MRGSAIDEGQRETTKPKATGFGRVLHNLVHRRRRYRQAVGVALAFLLTFAGTPEPTTLKLGAVVTALGMAVRMWASGFVMKNEVLATTGPYAFVRHPLYVGNLLICIGLCFASGLLWSWPLSLVFFVYFYPQTIRHEDEKLRRNFTAEWDAWAARTRALLPRWAPYGRADDTHWSFRLSLVRNGEPLHVLVLTGCLVYLWLLRL